MKLTVAGKQLDIGQSLKSHVEEVVLSSISKYFANPVEVNAVFSREAHDFRADISAHIGRAITVRGRDDSPDAYAAFDGAIEHIAKRLRRYKRRLRNHHVNHDKTVEMVAASQYVLEGTDGEEAAAGEGDGHVIVAEMATEIPDLTVGDAVMRMDLEDSAQLMFRNSAHGGLNMIYRRPDGNIGWLDPRGNRDAL